jgi:carbamate kinase
LDALKILVFCSVSLLTGCASLAAQQKAEHDAQVRDKAAQEIRRICALPEPERDKEILEVKEHSGFAVVCSGTRP